MWSAGKRHGRGRTPPETKAAPPAKKAKAAPAKETKPAPVKATKPAPADPNAVGKEAFKKDLEALFDKADTNGRGTLTFREIKRMLEDMGCSDDEKAMLKWFKSMDDGDNLLTKEELWNALSNNKNPNKLMEVALRYRFMEADKDESGGLTKDEFKEVLEKAGWDVDLSTVDLVFTTVDENGDGKVTVDEYLVSLFGKKKKK